MGYSPGGHKELDTTEQLTHIHTQRSIEAQDYKIMSSP